MLTIAIGLIIAIILVIIIEINNEFVDTVSIYFIIFAFIMILSVIFAVNIPLKTNMISSYKIHEKIESIYINKYPYDNIEHYYNFYYDSITTLDTITKMLSIKQELVDTNKNVLKIQVNHYTLIKCWLNKFSMRPVPKDEYIVNISPKKK